MYLPFPLFLSLWHVFPLVRRSSPNVSCGASLLKVCALASCVWRALSPFILKGCWLLRAVAVPPVVWFSERSLATSWPALLRMRKVASSSPWIFGLGCEFLSLIGFKLLPLSFSPSFPSSFPSCLPSCNRDRTRARYAKLHSQALLIFHCKTVSLLSLASLGSQMGSSSSSSRRLGLQECAPSMGLALSPSMAWLIVAVLIFCPGFADSLGSEVF